MNLSIQNSFRAYILPTKFGFDKRKAHLSSLICSGQVTREQALTLLQEELYPASRLKEDMDYVVKSLDCLSRNLTRSWQFLPKRIGIIPPTTNLRISCITDF